MAVITSNGIGGGNWSNTATWVGGVVPSDGDQAVIAAGDTVVIDGDVGVGTDNHTGTPATAAIYVNDTAVLEHSRTINSVLHCYGTLLVADGGEYNIGKAGDEIPQGVTAEVFFDNRSGSYQRFGFSGGNTSLERSSFRAHGAEKTRIASLASSAAIGDTVIELTEEPFNWNVGETVYFHQTEAGATFQDQNEFRTITAISGTTVTIDSGLTYLHRFPGKVCNGSSNVVIQNEPSPSDFSSIVNVYVDFRNIEFQRMGRAETAPALWAVGLIDNCFLNTRDLNRQDGAGSTIIKNSAAYNTTFQTYTLVVGEVRDCVWMGRPRTRTNNQINVQYYDTIFAGGFNDSFIGHNNTRCTYAGNATFPLGSSVNEFRFIDCDFGYTFGFKGTFQTGFFERSFFNSSIHYAKNCKYSADLASGPNITLDLMQVFVASPLFDWVQLQTNGDPDDNIRVTNKGLYLSNKTTRTNSNLSIEIRPHALEAVEFNGGIGIPYVDETTIPTISGETVLIKGKVRIDDGFYNSGDWIAPTITLSGLDSTPDTFTVSSSALNNWVEFTLTATNNTTAPGELSLTFSTTAKSASNSGSMWISGVPWVNGFVSRARHYGFIFNESTPKLSADPFAVADEATAEAYTGVSINPAASEISFSSGTADTAQKFYDYSRKWCVDNIDEEIPFLRAGASYTLASGWTVIDPYYSGALTWAGGTIKYTSAGAKTDNLDSNIIELAGDTSFSGTMSGTLDLRNSGASAITVSVPSGTSTTTANNTGGAITVEEVGITYQVTNIVSGSRIRIYNTTTTTEIVNQVVSGTSYVGEYSEGGDFSEGDSVNVRLTYVNGTSAKQEFSANAIAGASGWSLLAEPVDNDVYNSFGIDGSTITQFQADYLTDQVDVVTAVNFNISQFYAWWVYNLSTEDGIRDFFGGITALDEANIRINTGVLSLYLDNSTNTNIRQLDNRRFFRSDGAYPVLDPTSGGGGIDVVWRNQILIAETGVSGLTAAESLLLTNGLTTINTGVQKASILIPHTANL